MHGGRAHVLELSGISKTYGVTRALTDVSMTIPAGEIVGLIGHNGAGKSTLMRVIVGLTRPDTGSLTVAGAAAGAGYSMQESRARGVRIAYQELSLAPDLKVFENVLVAAPAVAGWQWRRRSQGLLRASLDEVFPGHRIPVRQQVRKLTLAQQQMLEIAQAVLEVTGPFSLLILDEPTSALAGKQAENLFRYLKQLKGRGISTVLITHKLHEVLGHTDRVVVMRDGRIVSEHPTPDLDYARIVAVMGGVARQAAGVKSASLAGGNGEELLSATSVRDQWLQDVSLAVRSGEIVGLSGLDGQGQQQLLRYLWRNRGGKRSVRFRGGVSFVTGDRQTRGVFPLWNLGQNISVGVLGETAPHGVVQRPRERLIVADWLERLAVRGTAGTPIGAVSGGNQQKALIARALASASRMVLLDDPFRGVDVETKQQVYRLMREETAMGRGFLWFTTENAELVECDRVYVMSAGRIAAELHGDEISEEAIIGASFEKI
ncbi:MAG: sugar ABC transporter ATP-binding protein [Streptosporangiaceae bacterium]